MVQVFSASRIFDGTEFHDDHALIVEAGRVSGLMPRAEAPAADQHFDGLLVPAFLDLQVNGGGGVLVSGTTGVAELRQLCAAHQGLGSVGVMPTLITDTAEATAAVIAAGAEAARQQVPGFLGLHLEGPHLDPRRKGAHDPALVRKMEAGDLARLCAAAKALPALIVTLAPEAVSPEQIAALTAAGVIVSLGHSDCSYEQAEAGFRAGARMATHLYNAMSQMGHRSPGLVGAVLSGSCAAGLIADGVHVHPAAMQAALAARREGIFLVSDCMAFAGTDATEMLLNGRMVLRHDGRLTLEDGTLAGADLTLPEAVANVTRLGVPPDRALRMASAIPAGLIGRGAEYGHLTQGARAVALHLDAQLRCQGRIGF
ncbi:N-acetylglucosamine-6-phosphate deacetylase [Pseudogemmobacter faecipullorum]|uniref:N-acetylglucosamine-6-phosphate deacetylase n=1 Tax=Pseudogemmobacter faecipullorum TaxID=2755041 RepID=A0ABS8CJH1_9RHOB|nr:N-acetylglucosamine-6-phosphate deacetylase [Pseudogemmobacter faecipullorum]MCB5409553.1 N-acetylglucosamine-6-phosphate deacetylase [Pseudogemmobacter faecipullorum]